MAALILIKVWFSFVVLAFCQSFPTSDLLELNSHLVNKILSCIIRVSSIGILCSEYFLPHLDPTNRAIPELNRWHPPVVQLSFLPCFGQDLENNVHNPSKSNPQILTIQMLPRWEKENTSC